MKLFIIVCSLVFLAFCFLSISIGCMVWLIKHRKSHVSEPEEHFVFYSLILSLVCCFFLLLSSVILSDLIHIWDNPPSGAIRISTTDEQAYGSLLIVSNLETDAYLSLKDIRTDTDVAGIYVAANSNLTLPVPIGTYLVSYAKGYAWYGTERLFGIMTCRKSLYKPCIITSSGGVLTLPKESW